MDTQSPKGTNSILDQKQSPLSSPSHEFSFTITLHPSPNRTPNTLKRSKDSIALDLAPADDIFFHGHLLPLQLLTHHTPTTTPTTTTTSPRPSTDMITIDDLGPSILKEERKKSTSFSSLSRLSKWLEEKKKKKVFDLKHLLKKYASMVEAWSKGEKEKKNELRRRPYSFSGNSSNMKERDKWMRRRGEFSAPASMRTSPMNSGHLLATPKGNCSSSDSSMDELQNAIQAAIAHCKSSTAAKERQG